MSYSLEVCEKGRPDFSGTIDVTYVTLMFFDTLQADIEREFGPFSYFEYDDCDGDRITVRGDEDMAQFGEAVQMGQVSRLHLVRSNLGNSEIPTIFPSDLVTLDVISNGQFGTVYRSLHVPSDRVIAVKCLEVDERIEEREKVLREILFMKKCDSSEFVVDLLGASLDSNTLLICLEYMDRGCVAQYGRIPEDVLCHISKSVLEGLCLLWGMNIMHRDLKPTNILVNASGYVKLADFGVSKIMEHSVARSFVGTSVYMPPERIRGGVYRLESDVWSFGLTVWELAAGRFPLEVDCPPAQLMGRIAGAPLEVRIDTASCELLQLIRGCLTYAVEERWNSRLLMDCAFIRRASPLNRLKIADFVNQKDV